MVTGPQQMRLEQALAGASETALGGAANEWKRCAELLLRVADALDRAAQAEKSVGGHTGPAMAKAFRASGTGMRDKQDELLKGVDALNLAADAVEAARVEHTDMDKNHPLAPNPGPYRPPPGPNDGEDLPLRTAHQVKVGRHDQSLLDREEAARKAADDLDTEYTRATDKMKQIHGIPDPVQPPQPSQGPSAPPTGTTPPSGGRAPQHTSGVHTVGTSSVHTVHQTTHQTTHQTHPTTGETHNPTTTTVSPVFDPTQPTVTHPVPDGTTTSSTTGTSGVIGGAGGVPAPLAGGLGVAAGGGLAGAAISGIRGGLAPTSAAAGAPARPIGSSARAGAPGSLGRGGGAAGTGSPTSKPTGGRGAGGRGAAGRGGMGGRGGPAGAGGGAGGRRGGAAGAGAAAGRRGGKSDQDEQGRDRDLFDDGQEWIDDAEAAPGVID